jgi:chemotaxis protein methyltransferase CheR
MPWEVFATDSISRMLTRVATGPYAMVRAETILRAFLTTYCVKGIGPQDGTFMIVPQVRSHVQFSPWIMAATDIAT